MEFGILGPLQVVVAGRAVPIASARQRAVLAMLLLSPDRPVSADRLVDTVWGLHPAASAHSLVRTYIWRLRTLLTEDGEQRVVTESAGYLLRVKLGELDLSEFERLAREGRAQLDQGEAPQAAANLRAALSLWRGEPFADITLHDTDQVIEARHLSDIRAAALEDRIEADLALGLHETLVPELHQLASRFPLRERITGHLMLACYRAGRQADALTAYRNLRAALVEAAGLDPGPEIQELHQRILIADPDLLTGRSARRPGERTVPRQLPAAPGLLAGRTDELRMLTGLLDGVVKADGVVVITAIDGMGGVGKTSLALHWGHRNLAHFPDGQLHVNLLGFAPDAVPMTPGKVLHGFLTALGVPAAKIPDALAEQSALYRSLLVGKKMLVLLDNARNTDQVRPLLPASSNCLTLVTSRNPLIGLVASEGAHPLTLGLLTTAESSDLLTARLGPERVLAEPAATMELIELCGRLPLALSIAAARGVMDPALSLADLAAQLRDAHHRLDALDIGDTSTDVRAVFSWSCHNLTPPAARLFRLLATHLGPDIPLAAVASLAAISIEDATRLLQELVHNHLLAEQLPGRFALHDLLRTYAGEQLRTEATDSERSEAARRLTRWFLDAAISADRIIAPRRFRAPLDGMVLGTGTPAFAAYGEAVDWFDAEIANLVAATRLAATVGDDVVAWQLPWAARGYFELRRPTNEWLASHQTGLASALRAGDLFGEAAMLAGLGSVHYYPRRFDEASGYFHRALSRWQEAGERRAEPVILNALGNIELESRRLDQAVEKYDAALAVSRAIGDRGTEGVILGNLAETYCELGRFDRVLELAPNALAVSREISNRRSEALALCQLGRAVAATSTHSKARTYFDQAIAIARGSDDLHVEAWALDYLGASRFADGDPTEAADCWRKAIELFDQLEDPRAPEIQDHLKEAYALIRQGYRGRKPD